MSVDLDRLEALLAAATPGPWRSYGPNTPEDRDGRNFCESGVSVGSLAADAVLMDYGRPHDIDRHDGRLFVDEAIADDFRCVADAKLVEAMHAALPDLVAELAEARARLAALQDIVNCLAMVEDPEEIGKHCRFCGAIQLYGPARHKPDCVTVPKPPGEEQ